MSNYKMLIEYDGTNFCGWQVQPDVRTVQEEIENALATLLKDDVRLMAAGRTDSGVHAYGQVANFKCQQDIYSLSVFTRSLNGMTGRDVSIVDLAQVQEEFNARFDAKARQYLYRISIRPLSIGRQYAYHYHYALDSTAMQDAASLLEGKHNFAAFTKIDPEEKHYLCEVEAVEWVISDSMIEFRIRANRFLRNMVRRIVGALLDLGRGKLSRQDFYAMLEHQDKNKSIFTAPAKGLFLEKVFY